MTACYFAGGDRLKLALRCADFSGVRIDVAMPQTLLVDLDISPEDYLRHYKGSANKVICTARDGRKIQFPTGILQCFVTRDGIHGSFRLEIDDKHKLMSVSRADSPRLI